MYRSKSRASTRGRSRCRLVRLGTRPAKVVLRWGCSSCGPVLHATRSPAVEVRRIWRASGVRSRTGHRSGSRSARRPRQDIGEQLSWRPPRTEGSRHRRRRLALAGRDRLEFEPRARGAADTRVRRVEDEVQRAAPRRAPCSGEAYSPERAGTVLIRHRQVASRSPYESDRRLDRVRKTDGIGARLPSPSSGHDQAVDDDSIVCCTLSR